MEIVYKLVAASSHASQGILILLTWCGLRYVGDSNDEL